LVVNQERFRGVAARAVGATTIAAALALVSAACGGSTPAAPQPLRPKPRDFEQQSSQTRLDCDVVTPDEGPTPLRFDERSIEEAENLANQGFDMLEQAQDRELGQEQVERLIEQAVHRLATALLADPYNVHATYNLAAAYARIGRPQCAINLLSRLVPLRTLPSQHHYVEEKLDRLLGRKNYRGRLDPDFFDLRDDPRFRELAKRF